MKFFVTGMSLWLVICFSAGLVLMGAGDAQVRPDAAVAPIASSEPAPAAGASAGSDLAPVLVPAVAHSEPAPARSSRALLSEPEPREREPARSWSDRRVVKRERFVRVDSRLLDPGRRDGEERVLELDLFDDTSLAVVLEPGDAVSSDSRSAIWIGGVRGVPGSRVTLVANGPVVHGSVALPDGRRFQISSAGEGLHRVVELDPAGFPEVDTDAPVPDGAISTPLDAPLPALPDVDEVTVIDLMVLYTQQAREAAGGTLAMQALVESAVARTNQANASSEVMIRHRLVFLGSTPYTPPSTDPFSNALYELTFPDDGFLDEVHALRDQVGADVVSLLIDAQSSCGIGWLTDPRVAGYQAYAFNVSNWLCADGNLSLAHEIGHNQGLAHDVANAGGPGVFPYSFGYQQPAGSFRTVMAYNCPGGCVRVDNFSNPDVLRFSQPTGTPDADNARSLNETRAHVAAWRDAPDCDDGSDADGDGLLDFPDDPGCSSPRDPSEAPDCSDGLDNDADGLFDFPADPECSDANDPAESFDTDGDAVSDQVDNCLLTANADQRDEDYDGFGGVCDADYDNDGVTSATDRVLLSAFYESILPRGPDGLGLDANGDGRVTAPEFVFLSIRYGQPPGPSGLGCAGSFPCH